ncbi:hypothetical protein D9757_011377 [Collybiopsis confluens]|uniref:AB hydrolase-1 domain-containing protein n=1 Tax=Collybiopsis confluens TaxID=2823264 RepID=A0A8H5LRN8_9AGAR|nr:hypothetical protein D9757_011377 [Collybiopsis confluens]
MPTPYNTYTLPDGIELSFTDSGAPPGSDDYTTIVVIHGSVFNAYQFHKVHAEAHALNLRTVLVHRRDHVGSTPYSAEEVQEIKDGSQPFWERLVSQVAQFISIFIERESIPKLKMTSSVMSGGIALTGWSAGCQIALSMLGTVQNPFISDQLYSLLRAYIGRVIIYDPPHVAFGYPLPADNKNYIPWEDTSLKPEDIPAIFSNWVSSFYDHPCYDPAAGSLRSSATIHELDGLRQKGENPTVSTWSDEEKAKGMEMPAMINEILTFTPPPQATLHKLVTKALFDADSARSWFPNVSVTYIGVTHTIWMCGWGEITTKRRHQETPGREMRFLDMDGANHFPHWSKPKEFMQYVANAVRPEK